MTGSQGNVVGLGAEPKVRLLATVNDFRRVARLTAESRQVRTAVSVIHSFLWQQGIAEPREFTVDAVEDYLGRLRESGRAPKTLANHRSALSSFCAFLVRRGALEENPCAQVPLRPPDETLPHYLEETELLDTLRLARQHRIWPEVCLAVSTGLRVSEMIRLQWPDIGLDRRCLTVRKSKSHRPRVVPLARSAMLALRLQRRKAGKFRYVFPARRTWSRCWKYVDRPRAINWWMRALKPIQKAVAKFRLLPPGSTGRGWHLLRHTFASRLAQRGVSLYKIASMLGHSDVRMARIYAHLQGGYDPDIEAVAVVKDRRGR